MKKINNKLIVLCISITALILSGSVLIRSDIYLEISRNLDLFGKVYKEISHNYVDEINPREFMRAGIKGMLSTLDPYTIFVDETKQQDIELMTNGKYGGIGVSIGVRGENVTIVEVIDGYSAHKQGLRVGDILIEAGSVPISFENVDEVSATVKGKPGTSVDLKILRNDKQDTLLFTVLREEIIIKNITYANFFPENSSNVYIRLANFSRTAGDELRNALKSLSAEKQIESIILDLRGNPGGLLDVAVDVCEKFLEKDQLVVSTKGKDEQSLKKFYSREQPVSGIEKLVVLINGSSASASEIVAGAIQDHDRGVILGTQSFGKGLVQTIIPLSDKTSLKITTAKYFTPSGRSIQKIDYSKDNPIIEAADSILADAFQTDNQRIVYSAGGITPDTTIEMKNTPEVVQQLLARGLLFSFADKYFYNNTADAYNKITDKELLDAFKEYILEKEFVFTSSVRKKITEIMKDLKDIESYREINSSLKQLDKKLDTILLIEYEKSAGEILSELKAELAGRYFTSEKSYEIKLSSDEQFKAAVELLSNEPAYNSLLNKLY